MVVREREEKGIIPRQGSVRTGYFSADATSNAETLRDGCQLICWSHLDAQFPWGQKKFPNHTALLYYTLKLTHADHWARLLALLPAFLGLAAICVHYGYSGQLVLLSHDGLAQPCEGARIECLWWCKTSACRPCGIRA